jgi:hypothetical protein
MTAKEKLEQVVAGKSLEAATLIITMLIIRIEDAGENPKEAARQIVLHSVSLGFLREEALQIYDQAHSVIEALSAEISAIEGQEERMVLVGEFLNFAKAKVATYALQLLLKTSGPLGGNPAEN